MTNENNKFPFWHQSGLKDCGPACVKMIFDFFKINCSYNLLLEKCQTIEKGTTVLSLCKVIKEAGLDCQTYKFSYCDLIKFYKVPCIIHWNRKHYVVLYKIGLDKFYIADPGVGKYTVGKNRFVSKWINGDFGIVIMVNLQNRSQEIF
jgi:ATP-binding cassette subfamily B protein